MMNSFDSSLNKLNALTDVQKNSFVTRPHPQLMRAVNAYTVFSKIGSPTHFLNVKSIKSTNVSLAWEGLYQYMLVHGVELNVCSPNISTSELYRFTTEELFNIEIEESSSSCVVYSFIYDDFYPDHKYDNSRAAVDDCMSCIFSKKTYEWMHFFKEKDLVLNQHKKLDREDFKMRIHAFQSLFRSFTILDIRARKVSLSNSECRVTGSYNVYAQNIIDHFKLEGGWQVLFHFDEKLDFWQIRHVNVKGLSL